MARSITTKALGWVPLLAIATACSAGPEQMPEQSSEPTVSDWSQSQQMSTEQYEALEQVSVAMEDLIVSVENSESLLAPELRTIWAGVEQAGLASPRLVSKDDGAGSVLVTQASLQGYVSNVDAAMPLVIAMQQRDDLPVAVKTAYDRFTADIQALPSAEAEGAIVEKARHHYYCILGFLDLHEECISMGTVFKAWAQTKCAALTVSAWALLSARVTRSCDD